VLEIVEERYVPTQVAATHAVFDRLGASDAAIGFLAEEGKLVLTNDLNLSIMLEQQGRDCIHYDRILRPMVLTRE
jgi:hypothetical protein